MTVCRDTRGEEWREIVHNQIAIKSVKSESAERGAAREREEAREREKQRMHEKLETERIRVEKEVCGLARPHGHVHAGMLTPSLADEFCAKSHVYDNSFSHTEFNLLMHFCPLTDPMFWWMGIPRITSSSHVTTRR